MTTSPFPFPLPLDLVTPTKEKMEIGSDVVDSNEFNLPPLDSMMEPRLHRQEKFRKSPPILLKWIGVKSPSLSWVKLMDREANFVWRPYVSIADGFSFALLDKDVESYSVSSENLVVLDHEHSVTPFILQNGRSCLNKAPLPALLPENPRVRVLTRRACQYWNEIAVRFNDYAEAGRDECIFPPPPSALINRSCHMKFSRGLVTYFAKEKIGFVAWHDEVTAWVAYAGEVPKPWKKYEPMAKACVSAPLARGEALNAMPQAKREKLETSVDAFARPPPLPKKVCSSIVAGSRVLPRTVLALHAMKDNALAPLNCAVTTRPLPGPKDQISATPWLPSKTSDNSELSNQDNHKHFIQSS
nr:hypothetical protein CFP56_33270 [Quercus suber]